MTVTAATTRNDYVATSGQTVFPYTFTALADGDIKVLKNGTALTLGGSNDYTLSGVGSYGGNVTLTSGATANDKIAIYLDMDLARTTNYQNSGDFLALDVNGDFDALWLALQQGTTDSQASVRRPPADSNTISMELPAAAVRANKLLSFDSTGAVKVESPSASSSTYVNVMDFGAKGNGVDDDGPAIQLAIDSLPSGGTIIIPDGEYLISTGVLITKGIRLLGAGRVNFNGYTSSFSPTVHSGSTLIRISDGVTAFSFNKGSDVSAFGCSIEQMSFAGTVITQAAFADAPVFRANTHAINMTSTAELILERLDFMNLDKCIFNIPGNVAVKPFIEDMTAKDCNYFIKAEDDAADFTVTNLSLIKMNYGIHTTSLDGLVMSNASIYRSYVSAMYDIGGGYNQISNFINISNCHFFESGSTLCYFHSISQLTITGCDFVRAGLVTSTVQTGLLIHNSETVTVSGGMIERPRGDGAQIYGNRFVDFGTNIMNPGYQVGGRTGLVCYDNQLVNVNCSISCVSTLPSYAANFSTSKAVTGTIVSDDIIIGRTDNLVQRGVEEKVFNLTVPSVIGSGGNVNLEVNIPYSLSGSRDSAGNISGQSLIVYGVEFPTGGTGAGVQGLTFRVNGPTQTFNSYTATANQTVFAYTFTANSASSVVVYKNGTLLTLTADYTVSGTGSAGGNITLASGATAGDYIWAGPRNDEVGDFTTVLDSTGNMEFRKQVDYNITGGNITDTFSLYLHNNPASSLGNFTIAPGSIIKVKYKICEYTLAPY